MQITIYSKVNCPNCNKAKNILLKFNPTILILDKDFSREEFFKKFPNIKTLPQVIIDNKHIGGYNDLEKWFAFNVPSTNF